jgi:hypothetical protein
MESVDDLQAWKIIRWLFSATLPLLFSSYIFRSDKGTYIGTYTVRRCETDIKNEDKVPEMKKALNSIRAFISALKR